MPRVKASVSSERELAVLSCVRSHLDGPEGAVISFTGISKETGLAVHQVRSAIQRLLRNGALSVVPRNHPNGASAENSYRLTRNGFDLIATAVGGSGPAGSARNEGGEA